MSLGAPSLIQATCHPGIVMVPLRRLALSMLFTSWSTIYQTTCTVSKRSSIKGTCQCKPTQSSSFALWQFTLPNSDSDSDSKPNGYFALSRSFHSAGSQIQIPILITNYRDGSESESIPESISHYVNEPLVGWSFHVIVDPGPNGPFTLYDNHGNCEFECKSDLQYEPIESKFV